MAIPDDRTQASDPQDVPTGLHRAAPAGDRMIGRLLNNAYKIEGKIGEGGMGVVYRATQTALDRKVAVKTILLNKTQPVTVIDRFFREAKILSQLQHPNVVNIIDFGTEPGPFIVMEYLHGESLEGFVEARGPLAPDLVIDLFEQICNGMAAAHQSQVIHRDLKPANVFVMQVTGSPRPVVKILDFGLGKMLDPDPDSGEKEPGLTREGAMMGTLCYSAPEQLEGGNVDTRADIYSLGAVLYYLVSGKPPYRNEGLRATLVKQLSRPPESLTAPHLDADQKAALEAVIHQAMSARAEERPGSAGELFTAVVHALYPGETLPGRASRTEVPRPRLPRPEPKPPSRRTALVAGGAAVVAATGAGLGYWLWSGRQRANGGSTAPGVTGTTIRLGMTGPFTGPTRDLGKMLQTGLEAGIHEINQNGGVHGRAVELVALDDGYEPERAAANVKALLEQHQVFAFVGNVGGETTEASLPLILAAKRVLYGGFTGAKVLRQDPPDRYVFNYRASFAEEAASVIRYLVEVRKQPADGIAVLAQNDTYGEDGVEGVAKALRKYNRDREAIVKVSYERNQTNVDQAVAGVVAARAKVRAVILASTYKPAASFIQKVKDAGLDVVFANLSFVGSLALAEELRERGPKYAAGVIVTQVVPLHSSNASGVIRYRQQLKETHPEQPPGFVSQEGYIAATILAEGLRRAGPRLTSEALVEGLETIKEMDLGIGTHISYGPSDHQGSHKVWGTVLDEKGAFRDLDLE